MSCELSDPIPSIAELLAGLSSPEAVIGIMDEHAPDETGHCRGCRYPTVAAPVWPCRLWVIADETRRNQQLRAERQQSRLSPTAGS